MDNRWSGSSDRSLLQGEMNVPIEAKRNRADVSGTVAHDIALFTTR